MSLKTSQVGRDVDFYWPFIGLLFDLLLIIIILLLKREEDIMYIVPVDVCGPSRTGTIHKTSVKEITSKLGFSSNALDDPNKVVNSWGFTADGMQCGIWDYRGSHKKGIFSTYGPASVFIELFGDKYEAN
jgi:hypothetical protein